MSTTSDIAVAASYSVSGASLLFKLKVNNFMQFGVRRRPAATPLPPSRPQPLPHAAVPSTQADLQWLSAFPGEAEILFPPLTYLQPTGRIERVKLLEGSVSYTIVEVEPHIS